MLVEVEVSKNNESCSSKCKAGDFCQFYQVFAYGKISYCHLFNTKLNRLSFRHLRTSVRCKDCLEADIRSKSQEK